MLSKRLYELSNLVITKKRVVDVGCDHALLGIYLLKNERVASVLAIDVNENAIKAAKANKKKYVVPNLEIMLNDGLENVTLRESDNVVISGMGTNTIIKILENSDFKAARTIIIQSNNNLYKLRKYMYKNKYKIDTEFVVFEKGKYYVLIRFIRARKEKYKNDDEKKRDEKLKKETYSFSELYFGKYTKRYKDYMKYVHDNLKETYKNIPYTKVFKKAKYKILVCLAKKRKK